MGKLRIVDLNNKNPLDYSSGGVGLTSYWENSALVKHGIEVITICYSDRSFVKNSEMGKIIGIKVPNNELAKLITYQIKAALLAIRLNPDIIVGEGPGNFGSSLIATLIKKKSTLHIERAHGTHIELIESMPKKNLHMKTLGRLMAEIVERLQYMSADYAICVSKSVKKELIEHYKMKDDNIFVVFSGTDTKVYKPLPYNKRAALRMRLGFKGDLKYLLYVGTDPYRKGLDIALRTILLLKNEKVHLNIIGVNQKAGIEFINREGIDKEILKNVSFIGNVKDEIKLKYYQASDLLFFPSRYEGISLTTLDALACGLPMIISKKVGADQIAGNKEGVAVVRNFNPKDYAQEIRKQVYKNNLTRSAARMLALKYDWKCSADKYYRVVLKIAKEHSKQINYNKK